MSRYFRTICLRFSFNCEATVRDPKSNGRGGESDHLGTIQSVIGCEVVKDDSLLLPFEHKCLNFHCLIGRHHHNIQGSACEASVIRIERVTIDLSVKRIGSHFEISNLTNERIRHARESLLEAIDGCIVIADIYHELHLFHLHGHDAGLKICDVWEILEEVLDFEDLERGVRDFGFECIGHGRDTSQLSILVSVLRLQS